VVEPAADQLREHPSSRVREHIKRPFGLRNLAAAPGDKPLADQQALYSGFGNALGQAVEFVATPFLFFLLGLWLDHVFGTGSILRVTFFALALVGVVASAYYKYRNAMDKAEEGKPWKR
jgi:F0F1-type ATP synthase assembly protein I